MIYKKIKKFYSKSYRVLTSIVIMISKYIASYYFVIFKVEKEFGYNIYFSELLNTLKTYKNKFIYSQEVVDFFLKIINFALNSNIAKYSSVKKQADKTLFVLHVCVWGEDYVNKILKYMLPSLLAFNNLPAFSNDYIIELIISCDEITRDKLNHESIIQLFKKYGYISYNLIPQEVFGIMDKFTKNNIAKIISKLSNVYPNLKYYLLGCLQNIVMQYAQQNKALVSFLMPDFIFSEQAFLKPLKYINQGKIAVVSTAFRTLDTDIEILVKHYYHNNVLTIPNKYFSEIAVKCMHKSAKHRIVSTKNKNLQITAQLIFHYPDKKEIVIRALHYHPLLVNFNTYKMKQINLGYQPIDSDFLNKLVNNNQELILKIAVMDNNIHFGFIEVSNIDVEPTLLFEEQKDLINVLQKFLTKQEWTLLNRYFFSKRCIYKYTGNLNYIESDIKDTELYMY